MEKNRKCKVCAEDTDADRAEKRNRTETRLVRTDLSVKLNVYLTIDV